MKFRLPILALMIFSLAAHAADDDPQSFAETPAGSAKIFQPATLITVPAHTVATAFVRASDYAPEGGYKNSDYQTAYSTIMTVGFRELAAWQRTSKCAPQGPSFAIWFDDPAKVKPDDLTVKTGYPVSPGCASDASVIVEPVTEYQAVSLIYGGDYQDSGNAWADIRDWVTNHGYQFDGNPKEKYLKGPFQTQNPAEWVTEIVWGVKKTESAASKKQ